MPSFREHGQGVPIGRKVGKSIVVPEHLPGSLFSGVLTHPLDTLV